MSFLDTIVDLGKSAVSFLRKDDIASSLARTAITGFALSKLTKSVNKENQVNTSPAVDPGVRIQVNPNTEAKIPVVYGTAVVSGAVTDAVLTNGSQTMFYCLTLCEKTGNLGLGYGDPSSFSFLEVYWNDNKMVFGTDGITATGYYDTEGNLCTNINGLVKVYCYAGSSTTPVVPAGYSNNALYNAYDIMPNWTSNHAMSDLVFAIVRVDYNAQQNIKGLANMRFKIRNTMTQPGDCLYDYMTNTRYGAGIDPLEIYSQ